jgi:uncharacterized protein (TIGR02246 family)
VLTALFDARTVREVTASNDESQLLEVQERYAATYDGKRPEDFASVFTEDGRLVLPDGQVVKGRDQLAAFAAAAAARRFRTHHLMADQVIRVSGDAATGAALVTAVSRLGDDVRLLVIGRYDDRMVRSGDGWQLSERVISRLTVGGTDRHLSSE